MKAAASARLSGLAGVAAWAMSLPPTGGGADWLVAGAGTMEVAGGGADGVVVAVVGRHAPQTGIGRAGDRLVAAPDRAKFWA